jgi:hypothetical protein
VPTDSLIQFMSFGGRRQETETHFLQNRPNDVILRLMLICNQIALVFHFSSQVWFVELVSHLIVTFHQRNTQRSRRESL